MDSKPIYKTAAELGIEQWEHDGLVALVGPLSLDRLKLRMFDFHTCDTAHCIGGWVEYNAKRRGKNGKYPGVDLLADLYFPRVEGKIFDPAYDASAPQAARAIVNFLVTGNPQWGAVMAEAG